MGIQKEPAKGRTKPQEYKSFLDVEQTEKAILIIKKFFQERLAGELNLTRVTAPLFVKSGTGINDDLNGKEKPVSFLIKADNYAKAEIVQSLAKWKRMALAKYGFVPGEGLYTDMNAIRPDEELDNIHSLYVDQWDWEKVIIKSDRTLDYLKITVEKIYEALKETEKLVHEKYLHIAPMLPEKIHFVHAEQLEEGYPSLTSKDREYEICKEYGVEDEVKASNMVTSVKRSFQKTLRSHIREYVHTDHDVDEELSELLTFLRKNIQDMK